MDKVMAVIIIIVVVAAISIAYTLLVPQEPPTEEEILEQLEGELDSALGEETGALEDLLDTI